MTNLLVHERVHRRHPEVGECDIRHAWRNAIAMRAREYGPPDVVAIAGPDERGRMLEMLGIELEDGTVLVYHAMRLTQKMACELGLGDWAR